MGEASWEAYRVIESKRKYWYKVLSNDAIRSTLLSALGIHDWLSLFGDIHLSDTLFSSLISLLLYDIPLIELRAWNIDWLIELPSIEEFLKGVLLKVVPIDVSIVIRNKMPDLSGIEEDIDKLIDAIFEKEFAEELKRTRLRKGVYDRTPYEQSYYDPPAVRDFLRSTFYFNVKRPVTVDTARRKTRSSGEALNIREENVADLFNRSQIVEAIKNKTVTQDYAWWDYSTWDQDGVDVVKVETYDGRVVEVEYHDLFDAIAGHYWDTGVWDYGFWLDGGEEYKHPWKGGNNPIFVLRDYLVADFRKRIMSTPYLVANYQKREERERFAPSPRLETFALPTHHVRRVETLVKKILRSLGVSVSPVVQRLYITAALQLYSLRYSDNKQGVDAYKRMSEQEFKDWWIRYWTDQGLDRSVLERIYSDIKGVIDTYGFLRTKEKIRFIRSKLRLVRSRGV